MKCFLGPMWGPGELTALLPAAATSPPPPAMSAAPLTLMQDTSISGQVEAKNIDWSPAKWNEHLRAVLRGRQRKLWLEMLISKLSPVKRSWEVGMEVVVVVVTVWSRSTWRQGNLERAQGGISAPFFLPLQPCYLSGDAPGSKSQPWYAR